MSAPKLAAAVLIAGWLANALAAKDEDVEAGIADYEAGRYEQALERFEAARQRRPERPELAFNRGLVLLATEDLEGARTAFETASESEDPHVRASAFYELGNLAFDAEDYPAAIEKYIEALKARPDHLNAKWNLELALARKHKEEEQEQENEDENEDEQNEDENQDENEDEQNEDEQNQDEQNQDENEDEQNQDEQKQDEQNQDEQKQDEQKQDEQKQDEQNQDEQKQDEQKQDEQKQDEQKQDEQKQDEQPAPPRPLDEMDVQKALEQLDQQDPFALDRPVGGYVRPEKDW